MNFLSLIKLDFKNSIFYNNRGLLHYQLGNFPEAIADYNQAILFNSNEADFYKNRGIARYQIQDHQGTIEDFNQTILLNPNMIAHCKNFGDAYFYQGASFLERENTELALENWNKAGEYLNDLEGICQS